MIESERKLRFTDFGGNAPPLGLSREHKAHLEVVYAKRCARKYSGEADDFGRGLLGQNSDARQAIAKGEKFRITSLAFFSVMAAP